MNPWFMAYSNLTGLLDVARPGAIIITGRGNRYADAFQQARAQGALVLTYNNPFNVPLTSKNPEDLDQFMGNPAVVPVWRFKNADGTLGPARSNWDNTVMADITPGSAWRQYYLAWCEKTIRNSKFDGFFMDTLGAQPWAAEYGQWPMAEQIAWTTNAVDLSREIWELIQRVNPKFIKIDNNLWDLPNTHPANAVADSGAQYCNGGCLENPPSTTGIPGAYHVNYSKRAFGGVPRVNLLVTPSKPYMDEWLKVAGANFTHVAVVDKAAGETYAKVTPAYVPYDPYWMAGEVEAALRRRVDDLVAQVNALNVRVASLQTQLAEVTPSLEAARAELAQANTWLADARNEVFNLTVECDVKKNTLAKIAALASGGA